MWHECLPLTLALINLLPVETKHTPQEIPKKPAHHLFMEASPNPATTQEGRPRLSPSHGLNHTGIPSRSSSSAAISPWPYFNITSAKQTAHCTTYNLQHPDTGFHPLTAPSAAKTNTTQPPTPTAHRASRMATLATSQTRHNHKH
jgi:hypothetical protein